jgi:hypothetical protein
VVAEDLDARSRGHEAGQPERGGAVDTESFVDDALHVWEVLDLHEAGHLLTVGNCSVEFLLQFLENAWGPQDPVEERAGSVRCRIGTGDELCQCFGSQLGSTEFLS